MIIYVSRTGNVKSIVEKLDLPNSEIQDGLVVHSPYFLFTYTDGLGEIPDKVNDFLSIKENQKYIKGVIVSGNINFGEMFCEAGIQISTKFNVPLIRKIDLRGTNEDLIVIKNQYTNYIEGE